MLENLRQEVHQATVILAGAGVLDSFHGGVTALDRKRGLIIVRPRTLDYLGLRMEDYLVVSARHGHVVEGVGEPADDLAAHLAIYQAFSSVESVACALSKYAVMWAQAGYAIPCLGYYHADHFQGDIPLVEWPEAGEADNFALGGQAIGEFFNQSSDDPMLVGGALMARVGPYAWGSSAILSARRIIALEKAAEVAYGTLVLNSEARPVVPAAFGLFPEKPAPKSAAQPLKPRIRGMQDLAAGRDQK